MSSQDQAVTPNRLIRTHVFLFILGFSVAGCTLPSVPLTTPEPLDVNINVKLDVYQYTKEDQKPGDRLTEETLVEAVETSSVVTPEARKAAELGMRNRMEQIQTLKNNRVIGENRDGLLEVREIPPGEYGAYTETTVRDENADRDVLMRALAQDENRPLTVIQREQAVLRTKAAFKGEWIEEQENDGSWRWVKKANDP